MSRYKKTLESRIKVYDSIIIDVLTDKLQTISYYSKKFHTKLYKEVFDDLIASITERVILPFELFDSTLTVMNSNVSLDDTVDDFNIEIEESDETNPFNDEDQIQDNDDCNESIEDIIDKVNTVMTQCDNLIKEIKKIKQSGDCENK